MKRMLIGLMAVLIASTVFALDPLSSVPTTNMDSGSDNPANARVDILEAVTRQNRDKKLRLSQFANFSTAKAAIGSTPKTLIIDTTSNVNNLTCPTTLAIDHETGGLLTVASGKILSIEKFIYTGNEQVFAGSGTVTIKKGAAKALLPQWWGAVPRSSSSIAVNNTAVGAAMENSRTELIPLEFTDLFYVSQGFRYGGGQTIFGHGNRTGIIYAGGDGYAFYNTFSEADRYDIKFLNFSIFGYTNGGSTQAINIDRVYHMVIDGMHIEGRYYTGYDGGGGTTWLTGGFTQSGIHIPDIGGDGNNAAVIRVVNSEIMDCSGSGIYTGGGVNIQIIGNRIQANSAHGIFGGATATAVQATIIGNDIEGNEVHEIYITYSIGTTIIGNHIEHVAATTPVRLGNGSITTGMMFAGNTVAANGSSYAVVLAATPADQAQTSSFKNNTLAGYTVAAFLFGSPVKCELGPNSVLPGLPEYVSSFEIGLDYYATGTWTPVLSFVTPGNLAVTYSTQTGTWTRRGNRVVLSFGIATSAFTHTTASGSLIISGLPYTSGPGTDFPSVAAAGSLVWGGITTTWSQISPRIELNTNVINLVGSGSATAAGALTTTNLPTGGTVNMVGTIEFML